VKKELLLERDQVKVYIFEQLLRKFGMDAQEAQALAPEFNAGLLAAFPDDWRPAAGVVEVVDWAKQRGYVLGVISNGHEEEQTGKLRDHGLLPYFDHLLFSQQLGFGKPDPRVFEHALSLVGSAPADVLVVGDSYSYDIEPAEGIGMQRIWIFEDAPILGLPDDRSIAALRDLPEKLQGVLA
jgi:HAD superfamily hydrolase (TIGR01509 family)